MLHGEIAQVKGAAREARAPSTRKDRRQTPETGEGAGPTAIWGSSSRQWGQQC